MKKFKYSFIASALLGVSLVGCYDMNTEPLGSTITADQKEETVSANPDRIEASATAVTALMSAYQNTVGNHADFGYPSIMLLTDCRGIVNRSEASTTRIMKLTKATGRMG